MPLFNVAVREHTYTGRFYSDVVQAGSPGEALQAAARHAAAPELPPGPAPRRGFSVVVQEHASTGRVHSDIVQAGSPEEALQLAAAQAAAPQPPPSPAPQAEAAGRPRCADVWVYALLHCDLEAGHDPPHMAVAHGYRRPVSWVRDDLGVAHALPGPATGGPVPSQDTLPSPAQETEPPAAPFTSEDLRMIDRS
jgi:hypothetical protein